MRRRNRLITPIVVGTFIMFGAAAEAATINYVFTGTADVTLNGTTDTATTFTVDLVGDTGATTTSGGEYYNTATSATFTIGSSTGSLLGTLNEVVSNPGYLGGAIIFGQAQSSSPYFVAEGLGGVGAYDLTTAFALINAPPNPPSLTLPSTFLTSLGNLTFNDISSISFEANVSAAPLPAALPLFASGLGGMGLFGWWRKRRLKGVVTA